MNELQIVLTEENGESKITSVDLCELINMFRKEEGNNTEILHKNLMASIRKEIEVLELAGIGQLNFKPSSYTNSQNKQQPCFLLNNEGVL